jgi:hypothetical protein
VNLVGFFDAPGSTAGLADTLKRVLEGAGVPVVPVALDHIVPGQDLEDTTASESGAPFRVSILATPPEMWGWATSALPLASRAGGLVVGLWDSHAREDLSEVQVDELWVADPDEAPRDGLPPEIEIRVVPFPQSVSVPGETADMRELANAWRSAITRATERHPGDPATNRGES